MTRETIQRYSHKDGTVSRSNQHKDMWIVNYSNGTFTTIHADQDSMMAAVPCNYTPAKRGGLGIKPKQVIGFIQYR